MKRPASMKGIDSNWPVVRPMSMDSCKPVCSFLKNSSISLIENSVDKNSPKK